MRTVVRAAPWGRETSAWAGLRGGAGRGKSDQDPGCSPPLETGIWGIPGGGSLGRGPSAGLEGDQTAGFGFDYLVNLSI